MYIMFSKKIPANRKAAIAQINVARYDLNLVKKDIKKGKLGGVSNDLSGVRGMLDDVETLLAKE